MEKLYYFFILIQPYLPMPVVSLVPLQAIFGTIFLVWLFFRILGQQNRVHHPLHYLFFFLFIWLVLADLVNLARIHTWEELRHVAGRLVFFVFVLTTYAVVRNRDRYLLVLRLLMISIVTLALFTIICAVFDINPLGAHTSRSPREFWGWTMPFTRNIGVPMSYGEYGLIINAVLPLFLLSFYQKEFLLKRSLALPGLGILLFAVFITQSRNAWLATFLVLTFLTGVLAWRSSGVFTKIMFFLLGLLGLLVAVAWLSGELLFLFEGFAKGRHIHTFERRLEVDTFVFNLFVNHWLFGVGHEVIVQQIDKTFGIPLVVHNGYLDQLASNGLFGFIPFISILVLTLMTLLRLSKKSPAAWQLLALCLAGSFVANMSALLAYKGFFSETFAIEYGLMLSMVGLSQQQEVSEPVHETTPKDLSYHHHLVRAGRQ